MDTFKWTLFVFAMFGSIFTAFGMWNKDTRFAYLGGVLVVFAGLLFLSGCAVSPERRPYMEVGLAYDYQGTVGHDPACIVRIRQPVGFGKLEPDWLLLSYEHHSSCPDQYDRNTIDQIELTAKIPLGRLK